MSTPYVGEIRLFGFPRTPNGWLPCDGSLQPISQYDTLYTLIGTTYGGDGITTFCVPDMRGRIPLDQGRAPSGTTYVLGQESGTENVTLLSGQMPSHMHNLMASGAAATQAAPGPSVVPAAITSDNFYIANVTGAVQIPLSPSAISLTGGTEPHDNMMPTLFMSFCISYAGIYPSQN